MTDMNRRSFILGGGLIGAIGATASAVAKASRPEKAMVGCKDHHCLQTITTINRLSPLVTTVIAPEA